MRSVSRLIVTLTVTKSECTTTRAIAARTMNRTRAALSRSHASARLVGCQQQLTLLHPVQALLAYRLEERAGRPDQSQQRAYDQRIQLAGRQTQAVGFGCCIADQAFGDVIPVALAPLPGMARRQTPASRIVDEAGQQAWLGASGSGRPLDPAF